MNDEHIGMDMVQTNYLTPEATFAQAKENAVKELERMDTDGTVRTDFNPAKARLRQFENPPPDSALHIVAAAILAVDGYPVAHPTSPYHGFAPSLDERVTRAMARARECLEAIEAEQMRKPK